MGIDGARRVVEDEDLGLFEERARNAEALLLTARDVGTALFDVGIVLVGEALDEVVCLRKPARFDELFVCRVGVAPAEVLLDGPREEDVLLEHNGDLIAKRRQIVCPHVHAAHLDAPFRHVVEAGEKVDERGFGRTRAADDADRFARLDVEVDVFEDVLFCRRGVFEVDVVEVDGTVLDFEDGVIGIVQRALFGEDLDDTAGRFARHRDHRKDHREHHDGGKDLHPVHDELRDSCNVVHGLAHAHDEVGTHEQHGRQHAVEGELHDGVVPCEQTFRLREVLHEGGRSLAELLLFVLLSHIRLDDADAADVFLNGFVHVVVLVEEAAESGHDLVHDGKQRECDERDNGKEDPRKVAAHDECHDEGEDDHEWRADGKTHDHHVGKLHVGDVRRHTGDERRRRELVDVLKREVLDVIVKVFAQVFGKARRCARAEGACESARDERCDSDRHQDARVLPDLPHRRRAALDDFDEHRDDEGHQAFEHDLDGDEKRR